MSLSEKVEEERRKILARRAEEKRASDEKRAAIAARNARLHEALAPLIAEIPDTYLAHRPGNPAHDVLLEIAGRAPPPSPRVRHRVSVPTFTLKAAAEHDRDGWCLTREEKNVPWGLIERPPAREFIEIIEGRRKGVSTAEIGEAVRWFEDELARALAAVVQWEADKGIDAKHAAAAAPPALPNAAEEAPAPIEQDRADREARFAGRLAQVPEPEPALQPASLLAKLRALSLSDWAILIFIVVFIAMAIIGGIEP